MVQTHIRGGGEVGRSTNYCGINPLELLPGYMHDFKRYLRNHDCGKAGRQAGGGRGRSGNRYRKHAILSLTSDTHTTQTTSEHEMVCPFLNNSESTGNQNTSHTLLLSPFLTLQYPKIGAREHGSTEAFCVSSRVQKSLIGFSLTL
jgi:hypothetical protein